MRVEKKVIASLPKCYAIAMLDVQGERSFLVATEKAGECQRYDLSGNYLESIWDQPGGVMTMVQVPGDNGAFLSTQRFFSPNDSKEAVLVLAEPVLADGVSPAPNLKVEHGWRVRKLTDLPFVHRFDILTVGDKSYLIACCLKSDHEFKEDWTHPGRVYVTELPADLRSYGEDRPLPLALLKEGLTKNHGYGRCVMPDGRPGSIIAAEEGVFRVAPPSHPGGEWSFETLLTSAASDATEIDFDGDGVKELLVLSPFHGAELAIYKPQAEGYACVYRHAESLEFLHAIWSGELQGQAVAVVGHRKGARDLLAFRYNKTTAAYEVQVLDHDRGPTNVQVYEQDGVQTIIATNRETDEVALYTVLA